MQYISLFISGQLSKCLLGTVPWSHGGERWRRHSLGLHLGGLSGRGPGACLLFKVEEGQPQALVSKGMVILFRLRYLWWKKMEGCIYSANIWSYLSNNIFLIRSHEIWHHGNSHTGYNWSWICKTENYYVKLKTGSIYRRKIRIPHSSRSILYTTHFLKLKIPFTLLFHERY